MRDDSAEGAGERLRAAMKAAWVGWPASPGSHEPGYTETDAGGGALNRRGGFRGRTNLGRCFERIHAKLAGEA